MVVIAGGASPGITTVAGVISLIITVVVIVIVVAITIWVIRRFRQAFGRPGYDRRNGGSVWSVFGSGPENCPPCDQETYRESSRSRRTESGRTR